MGFLDGLKGFLNPEIISQYEDIIRYHSEAYRRWKGRLHYTALSSSVNTSPTYNDKYYIATHRNEILQVEKEIAEEKAFQKRKDEVIKAAFQYPHAFHALVIKLSIPSISDVNATLPNIRVSKYRAKTRNHSADLQTPRQIRVTLSSEISKVFSSSEYGNSRTLRSPRTLRTLEKDEYEKLYRNLSGLKQEEERISKELAKEDLIFKFEDEILDNSRRAKYYKAFFESVNTMTDEKSYCATHINELDTFIDSVIEKEYNEIAKKYPKGLEYYRKNYSFRASKENVIEKKDRIAKLDKAVSRYEELKKKYPVGLPAFEEYNSYDDGKNSASYTIEEVVEYEDQIEKFEKSAKIASFYKNWETTQRDFSSVCRNLRDSELSGWGCYKYNIPFSKIQVNGDKVDGAFQVWQMFCDAYSESDDVDTSYYPSYAKNKTDIPKLLSRSSYYKERVYDAILSFIDKLLEKYTEKNEICVIFANSGEEDSELLNNYHFKYLKEQLDQRGVRFTPLRAFPSIVEDQVRYVVIELISTNERLKSNCATLINIKQRCHKDCVKQNRYECFSNIVYITLTKGYDKAEMEALNQRKIEEIERKRKEEEKKKQEEQERQNTIQKAKQIANNYRDAFSKFFSGYSTYTLDYREAVEIINSELKLRKYHEFNSRVKNAVSGWEKLHGIPYYFFYHYYPTRFTDITPESRRVRNLIYNFKDGIVNSDVIDIMKRKLTSTFSSDDLSQMTLVCIPASSIADNVDRYLSFSERLCNALGMRNAFNHITIIKEKTQSHLGGSDNAEYRIDDNFFNGKYIILFDDVVTRGRSMLEFKNLLENRGATIICALSIGRTYSDYYGEHREPHPWTNEY